MAVSFLGINLPPSMALVFLLVFALFKQTKNGVPSKDTYFGVNCDGVPTKKWLVDLNHLNDGQTVPY